MKEVYDVLRMYCVWKLGLLLEWGVQSEKSFLKTQLT